MHCIIGIVNIFYLIVVGSLCYFSSFGTMVLVEKSSTCMTLSSGKFLGSKDRVAIAGNCPYARYYNTYTVCKFHIPYLYHLSIDHVKYAIYVHMYECK